MLVAVGVAMVGLSGCGVAPSGGVGAASAGAIAGMVHGGQQPVAGATVTLMAAGSTGYGVGGTVVATTTSDGGGNFTLPSGFVCPTSTPTVAGTQPQAPSGLGGLSYILATGGNAGGGTNSSIAEAAVIGPCASLTGTQFINVTEVTTVAAAYALAPFATVTAGGTAIGSSPGNPQGLTNAAGAAANLANIATGTAHATGDFPGIVPPTAEMNTLANILASCVNQATSVATAGTCAKLFTAATPPGGVAPVDTFQVALDIAKNPGNNTAALFALATPSAPFQTGLSSAPTDFSVALGFNGGGITQGGGTIGVAIDAAGDAWVTTGLFNSAVHSLTEISPAGVYLSGATGTGYGTASIKSPVGVAIDQSGSVYVANNGATNVLKFNSGGTLLSTITATSFAGPNGITIDALGDPWIANFTNFAGLVTKITTAGVEAPNSPFAVGLGGVAIAAGPLAVWESDYQSKEVSRIDLTTFAVTNYGIGGPSGGVAIDHANNVWIAVTGNGNVFEINNAGTFLSPNGGFVAPNAGVQSIAIDGLGNAFAGATTGTLTAGSLIEFTNAGTLVSPAAGFSCSNFVPVVPQAPGGIDIDGSGNVWIAGTDNGSGVPDYVVEVVGIAAPVLTPKAAAVTANALGVRP